MPEYEQRLVVRTAIHAADWAEVRRAVARVTPGDMPMAECLASVRTWGGTPKAASRDPNAGFVESAGAFGMVPLADDGREMIGGLVGRFWQRGFGVRRLPDAAAFLAFCEPGYTKVVTNFCLER